MLSRLHNACGRRQASTDTQLGKDNADRKVAAESLRSHDGGCRGTAWDLEEAASEDKSKIVRIEALSTSVAQKVRGGALAPNIGSHMLQLVYNALDAKASSIAVKICLHTFMLSVRDDGHGMTFEDLRHCGERSATSKLRHHSQLRDTTFPYYGFRGESLAAISEFCHLEILSRSRVRPAETCRKVIHGGDTVALARVLDSTGIGSTVTCRDLFFNRPVARKMLSGQNRAGANEDSTSNRLQALLAMVRALAAVHPDVSFTVYEGTRIQPVLSLPKCVGPRQAFSRISKAITPKALFHVGLSYGGYLIKALLCPPSFVSLPRAKDEQFVYVNGRLCSRGLVHKRINRAYKDLWDQSSEHPSLDLLGLSSKLLQRLSQCSIFHFQTTSLEHSTILISLRQVDTSCTCTRA